MLTNVLRTLSVFFLLALFLAGNAGITVFVHSCSSSGKKDVLVYREMFQQPIACCCEDEVCEPTPSVPSFSCENCCKISHHFIKASFSEYASAEKVMIPEAGFTEVPGYDLLLSDPDEASLEFHARFPDPSPPPLSGIDLIRFIHQIRIPAPVC